MLPQAWRSSLAPRNLQTLCHQTPIGFLNLEMPRRKASGGPIYMKRGCSIVRFPSRMRTTIRKKRALALITGLSHSGFYKICPTPTICQKYWRNRKRTNIPSLLGKKGRHLLRKWYILTRLFIREYRTPRNLVWLDKALIWHRTKKTLGKFCQTYPLKAKGPNVQKRKFLTKLCFPLSEMHSGLSRIRAVKNSCILPQYSKFWIKIRNLLL